MQLQGDNLTSPVKRKRNISHMLANKAEGVEPPNSSPPRSILQWLRTCEDKGKSLDDRTDLAITEQTRVSMIEPWKKRDSGASTNWIVFHML